METHNVENVEQNLCRLKSRFRENWIWKFVEYARTGLILD